MPQELYYTPPVNEVFDELKTLAMELWMSYSNEYYSSGKVKQIEHLENIRDNFMYIFAMFDPINQSKIISNASKELAHEIKVRLA